MKATIPILAEDPAFLAVDKPAGFLVVPDRYDVLAPVVSVRLEETHGKLWTVHRLDKDTSGALLYARSAEAHAALSRAFESRAVEKAYRAVVLGEPAWDETVCEIPLTPDGDPMHRTVADPQNGKPSRTRFTVLGRHGAYSLVEARPETGRTHQIRVHCAAAGCPVIADRVYGHARPDSQLHLQSHGIVLPLSKSKPPVVVTAPPPPHMLAALTACGFSPGPSPTP